MPTRLVLCFSATKGGSRSKLSRSKRLHAIFSDDETVRVRGLSLWIQWAWSCPDSSGIQDCMDVSFSSPSQFSLFFRFVCFTSSPVIVSYGLNCCNAGVVIWTILCGTLHPRQCELVSVFATDQLYSESYLTSHPSYTTGFQQSRPSRPGEAWDD